MNANKLAEELENTTRHRTDTVFIQAAEMLRKQQIEIAELKNSRDYWCLQYKDVMGKLDDMAGELMSLENSIRFEAGYGHN
jgi:hypothetical protein